MRHENGLDGRRHFHIKWRKNRARVHFIPDLKVGVFVTLCTPYVIYWLLEAAHHIEATETLMLANYKLTSIQLDAMRSYI